MEFHCNSIVSSILRETLMAGKTEQFSITLPMEAIDMIEKGLIPFGIYGKKRSTVAAALILDMLKRTEVQDIVQRHMSAANAPSADGKPDAGGRRQ